MKILLVQDFLRSGGTERQSILLANAFAVAGHAATLLTFRPGGRLASSLAPGVTRSALQPFDTQLDWYAPRLLATAAAIRPDIVLCMGRMANCYAGALQRRLGNTAAVVATLRTGKPLPWMFRRSLQRVIHVVANSRDARDRLVREHGVPAQRISVIHNSLVFPSLPSSSDGGAPATAAPTAAAATTTAATTTAATMQPSATTAGADRAAWRSRHGATAATCVLLCVAMFRPEKNQRELIEIAAGLPPEPDWQLWLAGDGPTRAACEQLARTRGLGGRVVFPGFLADPAGLYTAADIAVHASGSESLSNFLIEAQAHGLLAVAYAAQGISECFVPDRTGWVIPRGDRAGFRGAIVQCAQMPPAERAARAETARKFARETFDPAQQVAAYLELFERLHRPEPPAPH